MPRSVACSTSCNPWRCSRRELYVARVFLKSGWLKLSAWSSTLDLFREEYRVPVLPPEAAAVAGTFGELFFPALLVVGFLGRLGALGTFAVNIVAVVSYSHFLLAEGAEAALASHVLWGVLLLGLTVFGPGRISLDAWLERRSATNGRTTRGLDPVL